MAETMIKARILSSASTEYTKYLSIFIDVCGNFV